MKTSGEPAGIIPPEERARHELDGIPIPLGIVRAPRRVLRRIMRACRCNGRFRSPVYRRNGITCARMTPVFLELC